MDTAMLQCIICPGQPRFSDASHLLTHVASKAHLSFYFKLQVRSHQEKKATQLLQEYDDWYNTNGLAQLLSERMTSKEDRIKKRKSQSKSKAAVDPPVQHTKRNLRGSNSKDNHSPAVNAFPAYLDPRLVDSPEQMQHESIANDVPFPSRYDTPEQPTIAGERAFKQEDPSIELGLTSKISTLTHSESHENANVASHVWPAIPETPRTPRPRTRRGNTSTRGHDLLDPVLDDGLQADTSNDFEKNRTDEMTRLKGVQWPGMDLFDSATQQMRRKRNQKKDGNVLKMMEMTSLQVEPTELIFSPSGIFRKGRVISGNVEDDSPLKGETPIPKRRLPRPKKGVLRQVDSNVLRAQDRKRTRRAVNNRDERNDLTSNDNTVRTPRRRNRGVGIIKPSFDGDDEMSLAAQAFGKRSRNGFTIFADAGDQGKPVNKDHSGISKAPRDTLTPSRLILDCKSEPTVLTIRQREATVGKENIEPIMTRASAHDWRSPFQRRNETDDAVYTPRYFYDESSHAHFGSSNDLENSLYQSNPLLAPYPRSDLYDMSNPYAGDMGMTHLGWVASPHVASSEATISDADHHDLARLYLATPAD